MNLAEITTSRIWESVDVLVIILLVVMVTKELYFLGAKLTYKFKSMMGTLEPSDNLTLGVFEEKLGHEIDSLVKGRDVKALEIERHLSDGFLSLKSEFIELKAISKEIRDSTRELVAIFKDRQDRSRFGDKV